MNQTPAGTENLTRVLATYRRPVRASFDDAWVGMEPTFQTKKSVRKWRKLSAKPGGEDRYFEDPYMLGRERKTARAIRRKYRRRQEAGDPACLFARVELVEDLDPWKVRRQELRFYWADESLEPFKIRFGLDPETFEFSIKPVPLAWFYDDRFVAFLEEYVWKVPRKKGMSASMAHGGGQFSFSAKTYMGGSLLADDIAGRLNHPELATWVCDYPNSDDRSFRCSPERFRAFREVLEQYWAGAFHPKAAGALTLENCYLDRGFGPAAAPAPGLMDATRGPVGDAREVFQTNFAFGRGVRLNAQNVYPGYWQEAHPAEEGYRPDQIMRYSEGNLNRLQVVGEFHVKSGKVLDAKRVVEVTTPLDLDLLYQECSWEIRAQQSRTSARDFVEAVLLEAHVGRYLQAHPHVTVRPSLLQDRLLFDAEATIRRHGPPSLLARLHAEAREANLAASRGRLRSDWVEPEVLFWAAWKVLPATEQAALAREVVTNFADRVHQAASADPRGQGDDPMEWHRHRIHPLLGEALDAGGLPAADPARRELEEWKKGRDVYQARRPPWSPLGEPGPWEGPPEGAPDGGPDGSAAGT